MHRIIQGECLEMMAKIPDRSIDFICADFPYNISGKGGLTMRNDQIVKADFGEWDKFPSEEAYFEFVFKVCDRVSPYPEAQRLDGAVLRISPRRMDRARAATPRALHLPNAADLGEGQPDAVGQEDHVPQRLRDGAVADQRRRDLCSNRVPSIS